MGGTTNDGGHAGIAGHGGVAGMMGALGGSGGNGGSTGGGGSGALGGNGGSGGVGGLAGEGGTNGLGGDAAVGGMGANGGAAGSDSVGGAGGEAPGGNGGIGGAGGAPECSQGDVQCHGNIPESCSIDGHWVDGPVCPETCSAGQCVACSTGADPTTCVAALSLGQVSIGQVVTRTSTLSAPGQEAWYSVSFGTPTNPASRPRVMLSSNPGNAFSFDVLGACGVSAQTCGTEGGTALAVTDWDVGAAQTVNEPDSPAYIPVPAPGTGGTVLVHVHRTQPATCDAFTLTITNLADCDPRLTNCDAVPGCETNLMYDAANCGACGFACQTLHMTSCLAGACADCEAGFGDCNAKPADGCEVDIGNDVLNCGACGTVCHSASCGSGACAGTCSAGYQDCDHSPSNGCESFSASDPVNCGGCGIVCGSATPKCNSGVCGS